LDRLGFSHVWDNQGTFSKCCLEIKNIGWW
jgi:hypothetical protein